MPGTAPAVREEGLVSPGEVRAVLLASIRPLAARPVRVADAAGLALAERMVAPFPLPRFDNAAMDGFALRSTDTEDSPTEVRVVGTAFAGRPAEGPVGVGEAVSIATGAMLPQGADAVVAVEDVAVQGDRVFVLEPVERGRHVRKAGEDFQVGAVVLEAGSVLGPGQLAAAAAFGLEDVVVRPRPRVAVLPTGDELRRPGEALGPGQVYESVSAPLGALIAEVGALREAAATSDAVVTVGGVSMGERDLIETVGGGERVRAYQVALRPARPFAFGRPFGVPLFGLPGNPAAALASFEEFVRPALLALMGKRPEVRPSVTASLTEAFAQRPGRVHLVRVEVWREGDRLLARPAGRQGAGMIHSLARAQGCAVVAPEVEALPVGAEIDVRLWVDVR